MNTKISPENITKATIVYADSSSSIKKENFPSWFPSWAIFPKTPPPLEKFPKNAPNLKEITIWNFNLVNKIGIGKEWCIRSFRDLPEKLPSLEKINFHNLIISNFEELTTIMSKLEVVSFSDCYIHNFIGIPSDINLFFHNTSINSFEGIEILIPHNAEETRIFLDHCTIHSFSGVSGSTLQIILTEILSKHYEFYDKENIERLRSLEQLVELGIENRNKFNPSILNIPQTAVKLIRQSINPEYEDLDEDERDSRNYFNNIRERFFIPKNFDQLHEYYRKTTQQLAQEYITDRKSLPSEQIERLVHEIDPEIRKMIENNLPSSDPIIAQMSTKFTFETENGLKILK